MRNSGIYKIQSVIKPERIYIGSASDIYFRWKKHLSDLRKNKHHSPQLQYHFNKYGEDDLVFSVIEPCLSQFLTIRENTYFNPLPYFNCSPTAGSMLGFKFSEELKQKLKGRTPWNKGKRGVYSKETSLKMSISRIGNKNSKGIKMSEVSRQKMRDAWAKRKLITVSEGTREKMRISHLGKKYPNYKGHKHTEETKLKMRNIALLKRLKKQNLVA